MRKPIWLLSLLGLSSILFVTVAQAWTPFDDHSITTSETMMSQAENDFFHDLNTYRASQGRPQLKLLPVLQACATWMSKDMQKRWDAGGGVSHIDSLGRDFSPRVKACGYDQNAYKGEIIAGGFLDGHAVFQAWKASSTHNPIMLTSQYLYAGVGMTDGTWAVDFASLDDNTYR